MEKSKGFISYQVRRDKKMTTEYAQFCTPKRIDGKKTNNEIWLGRVISKENNIFYNKKDGYFNFTVDNGKKNLDNRLTKYYEDLDSKNKDNIKKSKKTAKSKSISFGDMFVIDTCLKKMGLYDVFNSNLIENSDTLFTLIFYRILSTDSYVYTYNWWSETYMRYIFPNANVKSQRISEFIETLGSENCFREFFKNYFLYLKDKNPKFNILVDSTGLANSIKISLTAINNHNGVVSNEIRLIVVADKISGLPIYYRYVPGNIVDISTLSMIINELNEYNIDINRAIIDAGYHSENNIKDLYKYELPFMTRMKSNSEKYELLVKKYIPEIVCKNNLVEYGDRKLFIKKIITNFYDQEISLKCYICLDINTQCKDRASYYNNFNSKKTDEQLKFDELNHGVFILLSSIDLEPKEVLPCYYDRQIIEQIFDYMKNYIDIIPLRTHTTETLAGHLLISFMASIAFLCIDKELKQKKNSLYSSLKALNRLYCRVYKDKLIPDVPTKLVNDVFKIFKIKLPDKILLDTADKVA